MTEKDAVSTIANLRSQVRKPEDIESDDVNSILDSISEESIYKHLEEQELLKNRAINEAEENVRLKQDLKLKEETIKTEYQAKLDKENEIIQNKLQYLKDLLSEKELSLNQMLKQKAPIDDEIRKSIKTYKIVTVTIFILYYLGTYYLIWKKSWNFMEPLTYIINAGLPIIITFFYTVIKERKLNPLEYIQKVKQNIELKMYLKFKFDLNRLNILNKDIVNLKNEIESIKAT